MKTMMMMMMMVAALALLMTGGAMADDLPQFDSAAFCKATSSILVVNEDFTKLTIEACMKKEREAPDQIKRVLPFVDAVTIKSCEATMKIYAGGSYQGFAGCLVATIMVSVLEGKIKLSFANRSAIPDGLPGSAVHELPGSGKSKGAAQ